MLWVIVVEWSSPLPRSSSWMMAAPLVLKRYRLMPDFRYSIGHSSVYQLEYKVPWLLMNLLGSGMHLQLAIVSICRYLVAIEVNGGSLSYANLLLQVHWEILGIFPCSRG